MRSGEEGDIGCDCDRGIVAAPLLLPVPLVGCRFLGDSSSPGTPVKKKPLAEALQGVWAET